MRELIPKTHLDVLSLWSGPAELSRDIGLDFQRVRMWFDRRKIPPQWWARIADLALEKKHTFVSCRLLAEMLAETHGIEVRRGETAA